MKKNPDHNSSPWHPVRLLSLLAVLFTFGCVSNETGQGGAEVQPAQPGLAGQPLKEVGNGPRVEDPHQLRPGDPIAVNFSGPQSPPPQIQTQIREDGTISLPYMAGIEAAGKTRGELEKMIHDLYVPNYYKHLTVTVRAESRVFYVSGEVKNPNRFPYISEMTVLRAIAAAGDFTDFARKSKVEVIRSTGETERVNCMEAMRNPAEDVPIYPGDQVLVPRRFF